MNEPLVTVIIPVYKVEKFLPDCVESVINQTYKNLEIILVDDGSPDACGSMCDNYAQIDQRIQVIHKDNGGLSDARNAGIKIASGTYLSFIDSDDFVFPEMISSFVDFAQKYNADIVSARYLRCDCTDHYNDFDFVQDIPHAKVISGSNNAMEAFLSFDDIGTVAWSKLYRYELFNNIRYPFGKYHEDVFTTYKLVDQCKTIVILNIPLYVYRKNDMSITSEPFSYKKFDMVQGKIEQAKFIQQKYPYLLIEANKDIIYACNQCLILLSQTQKKYRDVEEKLQSLYRLYWRDYMKSHVSLKGKAVALVSAVNINIGKFFLKRCIK